MTELELLREEIAKLKAAIKDDPRHWRWEWWRVAQAANQEIERLKAEHHQLGKWTDCPTCTAFFIQDDQHAGYNAKLEQDLARVNSLVDWVVEHHTTWGGEFPTCNMCRQDWPCATLEAATERKISRD